MYRLCYESVPPLVIHALNTVFIGLPPLLSVAQIIDSAVGILHPVNQYGYIRVIAVCRKEHPPCISEENCFDASSDFMFLAL